jgi:MFS family permease
MFVIGCAIFVAASVVIALSHSAALLVAGRALQGLGSAVIVPTSLSIVGVEFPPERRTGAIAIWAGVVGLGLALGPHEKGSLDSVLSGSASSAHEAVAGLGVAVQDRFLAAAPGAVVHGFTGAARLMAVVAVVGAVGSALSMRGHRVRKEHQALHAAAHAAAPIFTAHHYASR